MRNDTLDEIHKMRQLEMCSKLNLSYLKKKHMTSNPLKFKRAFLIEWIIDAHLKFCLGENALYMHVSMVDRFLSKEGTMMI